MAARRTREPGRRHSLSISYRFSDLATSAGFQVCGKDSMPVLRDPAGKKGDGRVTSRWAASSFSRGKVPR
jgi:hypothetical protein